MTTTERLRELERRPTPVTHDEATKILERFCHSHFDRGGRISIPADVNQDDDLLMSQYIDEQREKDARRPAMLAVIEAAEAVERVWHKNIHIINSELDLKVAELLLKLAAFREVRE